MEDATRTYLGNTSETYKRPKQTSTMEFFCENSEPLFEKKLEKQPWIALVSLNSYLPTGKW